MPEVGPTPQYVYSISTFIYQYPRASHCDSLAQNLLGAFHTKCFSSEVEVKFRLPIFSAHILLLSNKSSSLLVSKITNSFQMMMLHIHLNPVDVCVWVLYYLFCFLSGSYIYGLPFHWFTDYQVNYDSNEIEKLESRSDSANRDDILPEGV